MAILIRVLTFLLLFLAFASPSFAATYYIDYVAGNDAANGTTTLTPWQHCPGDTDATDTAAACNPAAGDTLIFKGGVTYASGHTISLKTSGASALSMVTYEGEDASFGTGKAVFTSDTIFSFNAKNYNRLQHLEFDGNAGTCITSDTKGATGNTVHGCYFHDILGTDGYGVVACHGCMSFTLDGCTFEYVGAYRKGFGTHDGGNSATVLVDSTRTGENAWTLNEWAGRRIENLGTTMGGVDNAATIISNTTNTITSGALPGAQWTAGCYYAISGGGGSFRGPTYFQCYHDAGEGCVANGLGYTDSVGNTVSNNIIDNYCDSPLFFFGQHNLTVSGNTIKGLHSVGHSQGLTHYNADRGSANIFNNYYTGYRSFMSFQSLNADGGEGAYPIINIYNNIGHSHDGVATAIIAGGGISGEAGVGTITVVNNTFLGADEIVWGAENTCHYNAILKNNIFGGNNSLAAPFHGVATIEYNGYTNADSDGETGAVYDTTLADIFVDTTFNDVTDYRLLPTSPMKDVGIDASGYGVTTDYEGVSRPQDAGWDMGAYESGFIEGTTAWGHSTGVTETNVRTFLEGWTGTGTIAGEGDAERIVLLPGQYMQSEVVIATVGRKVKLQQNKYSSADTGTLKYRQGTTAAACLAAEWSTYTGPFVSLGYVQIRIEAP